MIMAKDKNSGNGGAKGDSGAPVGIIAQSPDVPTDETREDTSTANTQPADVPPDQQAAPTPEVKPVDIKAAQQRYAGRIPELTELRGRLATLEAEQDADGEIIADALITKAKANKTPPIIDLGGRRFRAKHDAEKRGGRVRLLEVQNHAPIEL